MLTKTTLLLVATVLMTGCASVSMEPKEKSDAAKAFAPPSPGSAGVYIFRSGPLGAALKKNLWIDGECVGESASNVFFYREVKGGAEHKISTESEFSPNDLILKAVGGTLHFVRQYIKLGLLIGGAGLEEVSEEDGKREVAKLEMATPGTCGKAR